ncbi:hypothetical protein M1P97_18195 [Parabacteroides sp. GYB001]|uniref:hypothetical protein n=1 Tax=Parabacteroides leei TaxID=2939491 RepID=UPI002017D1D9|nr:hypothetical protein [Parabacteroides leei]MCL3853211.1 hypothetical protein [Parabacteroides leei]
MKRSKGLCFSVIGNKKSKGAEVSESLLWEYDLSRFDWYDMRTVVVQLSSFSRLLLIIIDKQLLSVIFLIPSV